jgi:tetratricopeptide (TPR) repeat protein
MIIDRRWNMRREDFSDTVIDTAIDNFLKERKVVEAVPLDESKKYKLLKCLRGLRSEITRLDKIDSAIIKKNIDEAYSTLNIDLALRWEKILNDYYRDLRLTVDSILLAEVLLDYLPNPNWKCPGWLSFIRIKEIRKSRLCNQIPGQANQERVLWDCGKVIDYNPEIASAYDARGNAHAELGQLELAIEDFTCAININPDYARAYVNRGLAHFEGGNYQLAMKDYDAAIALDPENAAAYCNRGVAHVSREEYKLALFDFSQAVYLEPEQAKYYSNRGIIYSELGRNDLAIDDFTTAILFDRKNAGAYSNRGLTYYEDGKFKLAIRDLTKAIKLGLSSENLYNKRANAYKAIGKHAEADQDTLWALELEGKCYKG